MKILIVGNGDTATHLAKMLSRENQEVVVMGTDKAVLDELDTNYNVFTTFGKSTSVGDLKKAGCRDCDLFIAVTPYQNHNIVAAEIAKWLGAKSTFARIANPDLLEPEAREHFKTLGIDKAVYPEYLAAKLIADSLSNYWSDSHYLLCSGQLDLCALRVREGAPIEGMTLIEFGSLTKNYHASLIKRDGDIIIPRGCHRYERGDMVYFTCLPGQEEELARLCGKVTGKIKSVMIAGAGKITRTLCQQLSSEYQVKVIDSDRSLCEDILERCPGVTVINSNPRDVDILREEGVKDNCAFVALTDSSEANIVNAMVAKHLGAVKTLAEIEDIQYFDEARSLDIDTVVNKKLLTSSRIYQILLDSYLDSPHCLAFEDSEVAEIVACEKAPIVRSPLRNLKLSSDMTIAGLTRDGKVMLVNGDTHIMPGDHVVVFCMQGGLKKIEKLFRP
ncbi:MAG: Trk system potassium transporter TrkA [Muribaculaceae bacterium]|nr:Trk system potassium transporter TrkA [Muribaculaceae bacterium]